MQKVAVGLNIISRYCPDGKIQAEDGVIWVENTDLSMVSPGDRDTLVSLGWNLDPGDPTIGVGKDIKAL